jgi:hypothetical protein
VNLSSPRAADVSFWSVLVIALSSCAASARCQDRLTISDALFPGAVEPGRGVLISRLVDDLTGEPVAGAEVFLINEHKTPIAGEFWFLGRFLSDAEGFARLDLPPGDRGTGQLWWAVRHPRHGTTMLQGREGISRLGRGFDVPVRVTDWLGRPAAGARVGFCGGCGHTPDLVNATADEQGIAVLAGIEPHSGIADLYVQHPGLHFFCLRVQWLPGSESMEVRCDYAPPMSGKVIDHRGVPVAGAFVCGGGKHRGPWARTGADGSFVVLGAEPPAYPYQVVTTAGRDIYFDSSRAWPVTLRLPDLADASASEGRVEDEPAVPEPMAPRQVRVIVEGAPGEVELSVSGPDFDRAESDDSGADDKPAPDRVRVPTRGPFVLSASLAGVKHAKARTYSFADGSAADPIIVRWQPDVRVVGRAVDAAGQPVAVNARILRRWSGDGLWPEHEATPQRCADGAFDLAWAEGGRVLLELVPLDAALRPRLAWVDVPALGAAEKVAVGNVVVGDTARLRVVDARGAPLPHANVGFLRAGWQQAGQHRVWPLGNDGSWRGPDLRAGDAVVAQRDEASLPYRTTLQGDGPWTISLPDGQCDLTIVDDAGQPLAATIVAGDHEIEAGHGTAALRGLPHGALRAYVSAPGRRSAILDLQVTATPKAVRVALPKR